MSKQVEEGNLVRLELIFKQDGQQALAEAEILYEFQSVLPAIDEAIKGKKEVEKFELYLSPHQLRRWKRQKMAVINLNRPLKVEVFIHKITRPNPEELLHRVRQLFAGCAAGG